MTLLALVIGACSPVPLPVRSPGAGPAAPARRGRRRRWRSRWARRLDPQAATGLALTLAFAVIVLGGLVLGVLAYLVRGNTEVVRIDSGVADGAPANASGFTTDVLTAITHSASPRS